MVLHNGCMQEPLGRNVVENTDNILKCGFMLSYVPSTVMCFVYSVYVIPILSDITNVHLKDAFVVLIWFCLTKFEIKDTFLNRPVQIPS